MTFLNNIPIIHDVLLAENHRRWVLNQKSKETSTNLEFDSRCVWTSSYKVVRFRSFVGRIKIVRCRNRSLSQVWPLSCFNVLVIYWKVDQNAWSGTLWKTRHVPVRVTSALFSQSGNRYQAPSSGLGEAWWDKRDAICEERDKTFAIRCDDESYDQIPLTPDSKISKRFRKF